MRYYVAADILGFFNEFRTALAEAGYFADTEAHRLVLLGNLFGMGNGAAELQAFVLERLEREEVILIRGEREEEFERRFRDKSVRSQPDIADYHTVLQLAGYENYRRWHSSAELYAAARETPYYQKILPSMRNFYETRNHVFVHGWIPCHPTRIGLYRYEPDWRNAAKIMWDYARRTNGMEAAGMAWEEKTVVCSYPCDPGNIDTGPMLRRDTGIIAIRSDPACEGKVGVLVLEDEDLDVAQT